MEQNYDFYIKDKNILYFNCYICQYRFMLKPLHKINFIIEYEHEHFPVQTFWGEYRDLRELIADLFYPEDFGQCGGMGRCATCMVEIHGLEGHASLLKRNEQTTLARQ